MDSLHAHLCGIPISAPEMPAYNFDVYIKLALECMAQERYAEGISILLFVRDQCTTEQASWLSVIDTVIQQYAVYYQAQETLLQASRNFSEADSVLRMQVARLSTLAQGAVDRDTVGVVLPIRKSARAQVQPPQNKQLHVINKQDESHLDLYITCFGHFEVWRNQQRVALCQNRNGQAILRYLIAQPAYHATMDMLMETLWPNEEPAVARRKLQVAVSALRCSLNVGYEHDVGGGYILYKDRIYQINTSIGVKTDVKEFLAHYEEGQRSQGESRIQAYQQACYLYKGPFLAEDLYMDWPIRRREQLSLIYLSMCSLLAEHALEHALFDETVQWATAILQENQCDESAYCLLMRAYVRQGHRREALRQYRRCETILHDELGVTPMPETTRIFRAILSNDPVEEKG